MGSQGILYLQVLLKMIGVFLAEKTLSTEDISSRIITDSIETRQQIVSFHEDSLQKYLAKIRVSIDDSVLHIPQISEDKMLASNESMNGRCKS